MAKKKRYSGQFCIVCGRILLNEKFSGKGHAAHICKTCAKKPEEKRAEAITLNQIARVYRYGDLSRNNRKMLENYSHSPNERVRSTAIEAISTFRKGHFLDEGEYFGENYFDAKDLDL